MKRPLPLTQQYYLFHQTLTSPCIACHLAQPKSQPIKKKKKKQPKIKICKKKEYISNCNTCN